MSYAFSPPDHWFGDGGILSIPTSSQSSFNNLLWNCVPLSDRSVAGNAVLENICHKPSAMHLAEMEQADFLLNQCLLMQAMVENSESLQRPTTPVPGPLAPQRQRKRRVQACFAWNDGRPCAAVPCRFSHCCARLGIMLGGFALLRLKRLLRRRVVVALTGSCPGTFCGYFVWNFVV